MTDREKGAATSAVLLVLLALVGWWLWRRVRGLVAKVQADTAPRDLDWLDAPAGWLDPPGGSVATTAQGFTAGAAPTGLTPSTPLTASTSAPLTASGLLEGVSEASMPVLLADPAAPSFIAPPPLSAPASAPTSAPSSPLLWRALWGTAGR